LTHALEPPASPAHKIDAFLYLLSGVGIPAAGRAPELVPTSEERASLEARLSAAGVRPADALAVLHAGGNWALKRWPAGYFVRWIRLLRAKGPWKIVLCGTASEEALAREITGAFADGTVVSLCGGTSLGELAALMRRASLVVSNDSGPLHVAASQRARILGLYGPTSPRETGPVSEGPVRILWKDVGCQVPCYFRDCDHRACLDLLTPEEVFERTEELLAL
jgi:lipopolysaccharide heptosyltransferase II